MTGADWPTWTRGPLAALPTLVRDPPPPEFEALLERRRRLGQDLFDEVREGVVHMNPAPQSQHGRPEWQLAGILSPLAARGRAPSGTVGLAEISLELLVPRPPPHRRELVVARPRRAPRAGRQVRAQRQYAQLKRAHDEGGLIARLCASMENYTGNSDPRYLEAMARVIKRGLETWEHVLIRRGVPWEPYVTRAARRGAERCIADAEFYVPLV